MKSFLKKERKQRQRMEKGDRRKEKRKKIRNGEKEWRE